MTELTKRKLLLKDGYKHGKTRFGLIVDCSVWGQFRRRQVSSRDVDRFKAFPWRLSVINTARTSSCVELPQQKR